MQSFQLFLEGKNLSYHNFNKDKIPDEQETITGYVSFDYKKRKWMLRLVDGDLVKIEEIKIPYGNKEEPHRWSNRNFVLAAAKEIAESMTHKKVKLIPHEIDFDLYTKNSIVGHGWKIKLDQYIPGLTEEAVEEKTNEYIINNPNIWIGVVISDIKYAFYIPVMTTLEKNYTNKEERDILYDKIMDRIEDIARNVCNFWGIGYDSI